MAYGTSTPPDLRNIRYTLGGCTDMFLLTWKPVLDHVKKMDPSVILEE